MSGRQRGIVRLFAMAGLVISGWLLWQKANGTINSIAGCGDGRGCANVLGSRWSEVFHIPVSALAVLLYGGILIVSFRNHPRLLMTAAVLLIAAAVWFIGLQVLVIMSICPWCMAAHMVGLSCGIAIIAGLRKKIDGPVWKHVLLTGLALSGLLFLGQIFGPTPDSHLFTEEDLSESKEGAAVTNTGPAAEFRTVSYFGGTMNFVVADLPHIGPVDAPHVLVKFFDYTCASCRDMHGDLNALQAKFPGQVTVILLPSPLNRACNPYMRPEMQDHPGACEIARLALAAWRAKPEVFPELHHALFSNLIESPAQARKILSHFVSEGELAAALKDPWVEAQIQADLAAFQQLIVQSSKMPKLLMGGNAVLHGLSKATEVFVEEMRGKLLLKPAP